MDQTTCLEPSTYSLPVNPVFTELFACQQAVLIGRKFEEALHRRNMPDAQTPD